MDEIRGKHAHLSLERPDALRAVARALSSQVRLDVLAALGRRSMSVGELARALDVPMSTTALAVRVLEDAGLVMSDSQPGLHGAMKVCSRRLDEISIALASRPQEGAQPLVLDMPVGGYASADGIRPTCGLLSEAQPLGPLDMPRMFYSPERFGAQLIWFQQGFLEYRFGPPDGPGGRDIAWLELSFEACSEAPMYREAWPSDISVEVNGRRLGVWTCPGDCGGRQGRFTPAWWGLINTQYGFLKTWRVDAEGSFLDGERVSDVTLRDLDLGGRPCLSVRIGVDPRSANVRGINLFGEKFGDYPQSIRLRIGYSM